jgi:hypothetical protein
MNTLFYKLDLYKENTYAAIIYLFGEVQTQKRMKNEEEIDFLEPYKMENVAMKESTTEFRIGLDSTIHTRAYSC